MIIALGTNRYNDSPSPNIRLIEQSNQGPGLVDHGLGTRMQPGINKHDHRPGTEVKKRETELYELFDAENAYAWVHIATALNIEPPHHSHGWHHPPRA